ncbi:MAG TPA: DNA methyltransferase [Candidatus Acidoferrales bacterium]|nr:DNA methyltransferase [Candidatus Acidoferrales bacterium]
MKNDPLEKLAERLNSLSVDNFWDVGKFVVEKILPYAKSNKLSEEELYKVLSSYPGFKFQPILLKQCQMYFTYYPDLKKRKLPESFYFELATKVSGDEKRKEYEKAAIQNKWTIIELRKKVREDSLSEREAGRTKFGFDLRAANVWSFDVPDPRFGKQGYKGRIAGQVIANAIYHYTNPGASIVDPFAGDGTLGDVAEKISYFGDRSYKMFDPKPSDERIKQNNVFLTGIPADTNSADYVFINLPDEFYSGNEEMTVALSNFKMKFKTVFRESHRILKVKGKVSVIVAPQIGETGVADYPYEVERIYSDANYKIAGKVFLPERSARRYNYFERKPLVSEMTEMLTFQKMSE